MSESVTQSKIDYAFAMQRLEQEKQTFEQQRDQANSWFKLRLIMGYMAVIVIVSVGIFCGFMLINYKDFDNFTLRVVSCALFVDILGVVLAVWKVVIGSGDVAKLGPVTNFK